MTRLRRHAFDVLIVLGALQAGVEVAAEHEGTARLLGVPAIALVILPLLARRQFPFAAPAAVWLVAVVVSFANGNLVVSTAAASIAGMAAGFLLGSLRDDVRARVGLAIVVGGAATVVYNAPDRGAGEVVFTTILFGISWLAGFALRERSVQAEAAEERAEAAERERETAARIAVAEERARIARELHDIVAHSVSVMVLQVGAVRHNLPDSLADDKEALTDVEHAGRAALAEMRRLLGVMRDDRDGPELAPQPSLDELDALVERIGRAGLPVRLHVEGDPVPLPRALGLSVYRIVQEALTNAVKHAHANFAEIRLRYDTDALHVEVRDDGIGAATNDGLGHGLVGIRERVKIYGGEMSAGAAPGGGFVLSASLPLEGVQA